MIAILWCAILQLCYNLEILITVVHTQLCGVKKLKSMTDPQCKHWQAFAVMLKTNLMAGKKEIEKQMMLHEMISEFVISVLHDVWQNRSLRTLLNIYSKSLV